MQIARPLCLAARHDNGPWLWQEHYGHLHFDALQKLAREKMVIRLPHVEHGHQLCTDCVTIKLKRKPIPAQVKRRTDGILDLVHGDFCGPISLVTPGGKTFLLLLVDDHSRYMWLSLLSSKSEMLAAVQRFQMQVEVETGCHLRVLRTNHGGEFTLIVFEKHNAKHSIKRQHSTPYMPQQNGVVEQRNQTIVTMARSLLKGRGLHVAFWEEAVTMAVFLLNRAPTKRVAGKTLFEAWHGHKPNVEFLCTFGCVAYVKTARPHPKKLDDTSVAMIFIGYKLGDKAWHFYDTAARRVPVSRNAVFQEHVSWKWSEVNDDELEHGSKFVVDYVVEEAIGGN